MLQYFEVGKLFKEGVTRYREGIRFDFDNSGANLYIYFESPSEEEIMSVEKEGFKIAYYTEDEVLMMLFKFKDMPWMDAPYSVHLSTKSLNLQDIAEGMGYGLAIFLIDARTGILKAARQVSMQTKFSRSLKKAIERQKTLPYDSYNFNRKINGINSKYTTKQLVDRKDEYCTIGLT